MQILTAALLPCLIFVFSNACTVRFSKRAFGHALPVTLFFSVFALYVSQFVFKTFYIGIFVVLTAALLGLLIILYETALKKNTEFKKNFFTVGLSAFLMIGLLFFITDNGRHFIHWDEFSHWGKMVKEMFRTDRFYCENGTYLLLHPDYPPFMPLFEYMWCVFSGKCSEANMTIALHVFEFGVLVPFFAEKLIQGKKTVFEKALPTFALLLTVLLTTVMFDSSEIFVTICLDICVSLVYVYIIALAEDAKNGGKFGFFALLSVLCGFILIKQISVAFVMLIWLFFTAGEFLADDKKDKISVGRKILRSAAVFFAPFASQKIWEIYTRTLSGQFDPGRISPAAVLWLFSGKASEVAQYTLYQYADALLMRPITTGVLKLSYISGSAAAFILLYFLCKYFYGKKTFIKYALTFAAGTFGYALVIIILYVFCFSENEQVTLASYERYMSTYLLSEYLILLFMLLSALKKSGFNISNVYAGIAAALFIITDAAALKDLSLQSVKEEEFAEYRMGAVKIENNTDMNEKVYVLSDYNIKTVFYINYYLNNRVIDDVNMSDLHFEGDAAHWQTTVENIKKDNYLYVFEENQILDDVLGKFTDEGRLYKDTLYLVVHESEDLKLIPIA